MSFRIYEGPFYPELEYESKRVCKDKGMAFHCATIWAIRNAYEYDFAVLETDRDYQMGAVLLKAVRFEPKTGRIVNWEQL